MEREEKIKKIKDYLETGEDIENFCERVVEEYFKYDNLKQDIYRHFCIFDLGKNEIRIETEDTCWNETDYASIYVPLDVFYNDNVEEYVKNLSEERTKEEEQEKKRKEARDKQKAIEEIKRLKEKYNI